MKKGTIVLCKEDVIMSPDSELDANKRMFTKGKYYRIYPWNMEDGWELVPTICAKNDMKERHILIKDDDKEFFNKHFEVIDIN